MGKALATLNKAWEVHQTRNPNADYFSFVSGWDAAAYGFIPGEDEDTKVRGEWPAVIETAEQTDLPWPEGTRLADRHEDIWEKRDGYWTIVRWSWQDEDELGYTDYELYRYLPAKVERVGA